MQVAAIGSRLDSWQVVPTYKDKDPAPWLSDKDQPPWCSSPQESDQDQPAAASDTKHASLSLLPGSPASVRSALEAVAKSPRNLYNRCEEQAKGAVLLGTNEQGESAISQLLAVYGPKIGGLCDNTVGPWRSTSSHSIMLEQDFDDVDTNNDGVIDRKEFAAAAARHSAGRDPGR